MSLKHEIVSAAISVLTNENVRASLFGKYADGRPRTLSDSLNGNSGKVKKDKVHKKKKKKKQKSKKELYPSIFSGR